MKFSRRRLLQVGGAYGSTLALSGISPLVRLCFAARPTYRGVTYLTPAYRAAKEMIDGFVLNLRKSGEDVLNLEFYDSGSLMTADQQILGLKGGAIQFMFHTSSYLTQAYPILGIMGLPAVCQQLYEHGERLAMESPLWKLINDHLARSNLFMLTAGGGLLEPEYIWSADDQIVSLADLKDKRCRVVGHEAEQLLKSFGAEGMRVPSADTYLAVQRKTVDAVLANISTIIARSLYKLVKQCYKIPIAAFSISVFFLKDTWDKMPIDQKAAFWAAGQWYDTHAAKGINTRIYPEEYWPIAKKTGIGIVEPTQAELEILAQRALPVRARWETQVGEEVGRKAVALALGKT